MLTKIIQQRYLNFPVKSGGLKRQVNILVDGQLLHDFTIELAEEAPDFWVFLDVNALRGKKAVLQINPPLEEHEHGLEPVVQSDSIIGLENVYNEALRPQFHFTARRGWLNDPNGLVYYNGVYHLFYQHNPYGAQWGNMHWGHATSQDLVHWQEHPITLYPDAMGTMFSGSAVVDWDNTSGLQQGQHPPIVLLYTAAGETSGWSKGQSYTQCLAYSTDGGQSFTKHPNNPVIPWIEGANRDPKVIWHAPTSRWVMALYLEADRYAILTSPDLFNWQPTSGFTIPQAWECPDLFELPVDGDPQHTRWVAWSANTFYLVGQFDGERFAVETIDEVGQYGGNAYAAQTYSDIPAADGRRIQVGWLRGDLPGMPFNQQMAFPVSLSLRDTPQGPRLCYQPVQELETLHAACHAFGPQTLAPGEDLLAGLADGAQTGTPGAYDLRLELEPGTAQYIDLTVRGVAIRYDTAAQTLTCQGHSAPAPLLEGKLRLQVLVDRASLEIFAGEGQVYLPLHILFPQADAGLSLQALGGTAEVCVLEVYELHSAWEQRQAT